MGVVQMATKRHAPCQPYHPALSPPEAPPPHLPKNNTPPLTLPHTPPPTHLPTLPAPVAAAVAARHFVAALVLYGGHTTGGTRLAGLADVPDDEQSRSGFCVYDDVHTQGFVWGL